MRHWVSTTIAIAAVMLAVACTGPPVRDSVVGERPVAAGIENRQRTADPRAPHEKLAVGNQVLAATVRERLREEPALDVRSITVNADRGTVTLEGTVRTVGEKTRAEQAALQVAGVLTVVNRLQVEDFGTARDELTPDVMGRVD